MTFHNRHRRAAGAIGADHPRGRDRRIDVAASNAMSTMPKHASDHQRQMMLRFHREYNGDEIAICDAYARAEASGHAFRKRGDYRLTSHDYAKAMLFHGREQGWLSV